MRLFSFLDGLAQPGRVPCPVRVRWSVSPQRRRSAGGLAMVPRRELVYQELTISERFLDILLYLLQADDTADEGEDMAAS